MTDLHVLALLAPVFTVLLVVATALVEIWLDDRKQRQHPAE